MFRFPKWSGMCSTLNSRLTYELPSLHFWGIKMGSQIMSLAMLCIYSLLGRVSSFPRSLEKAECVLSFQVQLYTWYLYGASHEFRLHILIGGVWILLTNFCVYKSVCIPIGVEEPVSKIVSVHIATEVMWPYGRRIHLGITFRCSNAFRLGSSKSYTQLFEGLWFGPVVLVE